MSKVLVDQRRSKIRQVGSEKLVSKAVVYVMAREQRVENNWALLYAQAEADKNKLPLLVLFVVGPMFNNGSARQNEWMVQSLREVEVGLAKYKIPFFVRGGPWAQTVRDFVVEYQVGTVVFDFNPLQPVRSWRDELVELLPAVKLVEVDARNIIPCWVASNKAEYAAYTIRPKIHKLLSEFLTPFPSLKISATKFSAPVPKIDWAKVRAYRQCDYSVSVPTIYKPGTEAGLRVLSDFISNKLTGYSSRRNDPNQNHVSNLSPYLRWGNISAQAVALAIKSASAPSADKEAFLEELIIRRELADNFCFYTPDYNKVAGAHLWAQKTITAHAKDKREYLYDLSDFEYSKTHDALWNATQRQMVQEGKMHGFLRMYWAKKILEWTPDAQSAIDTALLLNDKYQLDGRDSNGVVGIMWSICGVHDRAWNERPIFGKIRYMNYAGCKRKFDVKTFESRYADSQENLLP